MDGKLTFIDKSEVLRYLRIPKNKTTDEISNNIDLMIEAVFSSAHPRIIYNCFDYLPFKTKSKNIAHLLNPCVKTVLFCATLGIETDKLISRYQIKDLSLAVIIDAAANCAIENVCDNFQNSFENTTPRFSPGYGDFSLSHQKDFESILNIGKIGVSLTPSNLFIPTKSVSAVFGIQGGSL